MMLKDIEHKIYVYADHNATKTLYEAIEQSGYTVGEMYIGDKRINLDKFEEKKMLEINYKCYKCGHKWIEEYDCACDSECPECDARNCTAVSYKEID